MIPLFIWRWLGNGRPSGHSLRGARGEKEELS